MAAAALGTKGLAGSLRLVLEAGLHLCFQDLADAGAREVLPDLHLLRGFDAADAGLDEDADLVGGDGVARMELEDGGDPLASLGQPATGKRPVRVQVVTRCERGDHHGGLGLPE
jgi:hypothetical protein